MKKPTTEIQTRLILRFIDVLRELHNAGVSIVRNNDNDDLMFFNSEDVEEFVNWDDSYDFPEAVDITDFADSIVIGSIVDHAYYPEYGKERVLAVLK